MKISCSSLQMYWRCPELYRKVYVDKEIPRAAPDENMVRGTAVHAAIEFALKAKIAGKSVGLPSMLSVLDAAIDSESKKMIISDTFAGLDNILAPVRQAGEFAVKAYHKSILPFVNPVAAEYHIVRQVSADVQFEGFIDCVDRNERGELVIRDAKISGSDRTPDQDSAASSVQLALYAIMYQSISGEKVLHGTLDNFVNSKRPHYLSRHVQFTQQGLDAVWLRVERTVAAIKAGQFPPGDSFWVCTPKRCPQHATCPMGAGVPRGI
jgi:hypothetical protein